MTTNTIEYGGKTFEVPEGVTPEAALEGLKAAMPELAAATLEKKGSSAAGGGHVYVAKPSVGTKG